MNNLEFVRSSDSECFVYNPTARRRVGVGIQTCYVGPTPGFRDRQPWPDVGPAIPSVGYR